MNTSSSAALHRLQTLVWGVGVAVCVGLVIELATARHWHGFVQLIPWIAIGATLVAAALTRAGQYRAALIILGIVALASIYGMWEHIEANMSAGQIGARYEGTWDDFGIGTRLWKAVSMDVGKSPPLVPGSMILAAVLIALSTPVAIERDHRS